MHTSEYEHIKEGKREKFLLLTSSLYCLSLYLLLPAFSGNHLLLPASSGIPRRTMNKPLHCLFSQTMGFWAFIARLTGCPPSSRPILVLRSSCAPAGVYAIRPFRRLRCLDGRSKGCMHCMHQKRTYALYART